MTMRFKPAFRFQLRDMLTGGTVFYLIMVLIVACSFLITALCGGSSVSFNGFGVSMAVSLFIFGVVTPRSHLRLCSQMGLSRRTAFWGALAAALCNVVLLALAGEVLLTVATSLPCGGNLIYGDLYQLIYLDGSAARMTLPQHLYGVVFNASLPLAMFCGGMFFTLLFWRLSRFWTVAAGLAIPAVCIALPMLTAQVPALAGLALDGLAWMGASVWNAAAVFLLTAAAATAVNCWLLRRANIRAAAK